MANGTSWRRNRSADDPEALGSVVVSVNDARFLHSDGQKMSKRKKNYPDPGVIVQNYGADALR